MGDPMSECTKQDKYKKREFDELIELLEYKGVKFNIKTKEEAYYILHDLNYYYKITVYKRNFLKGNDDKYINLEFSYLADLASIDMQLRYLFLAATLDIEHSLKTLLITKITENKDIDGYDIVQRFFHSTQNNNRPLNETIVLGNIRDKSHYQYNLYNTHKNAISAWVLLEVISFGDFLRFFEFYFKKYSDDDFIISSLMGPLAGVKRIRNASAHSTPFLFDLENGEVNRVSNYIKDYSEKKGIGELFYKCYKMHDMISLFFIHEKFVKGKGSRYFRIESFRSLIVQISSKITYGDKNTLRYFSEIIKKIIDNYMV